MMSCKHKWILAHYGMAGGYETPSYAIWVCECGERKVHTYNQGDE